MTRRGRPLRFLAATIGGWAVLRTGMLWPTLEVVRDVARALAPPAVAAPAPLVSRPLPAPVRRAALAAIPRVGPATRPEPPPPRRRAPDPTRIALAAASFLSFGRAVPIDEGVVPPPLRPTPASPTRRLTGSIWAIARDGVGGGLPGGQLGGSQAGVRVAYAIGDSRRVALTARLSAPLQGRGSEAAVGVEVRAARLPIRALAERRFALDGGRDATAVYAVGGIAPTPVAAGFRLEAYAQGGAIVRGRAEAFADGAARLTRAVSPTLDLGIGAWGGAQRGAARVDVGPTVGVAVPVAGRRVRLSIDWRQRIAGAARPGSGPAVSIGGDF